MNEKLVFRSDPAEAERVAQIRNERLQRAAATVTFEALRNMEDWRDRSPAPPAPGEHTGRGVYYGMPESRDYMGVQGTQ